uniref:Gamma-glutamyltransferase 5a n=1 Tax=Sparus aurata TaxID=8175 RepID=A0A671XEN2_SPAAU
KLGVLKLRLTRPLFLGVAPKFACSHWIGVPGEIRGYEKAHRMYGKLPWADLFQPTIKLAREGFPVPPVQGRYIHKYISNATQKLRELFSDQSGNLLKAGDIVKFKKLADTLEVIAEKGADEFYSGRIAQDLISDIQEAGGTLTAEDLEEYAVTVTDAWAVPLGEYQMYIPPPPAGATVLSLILNILKGYQLSPASLSGEKKTLAYHRYIEAFKFANGLKKYIRDPKFVSEELAKKFTTDSFADHIRSLIRDKTLDPEIYNIAPSVDGVGTTHLSVLAEDGSAVSVSSTINHIFGSKIFSPRTGIILNDELSDFCGRVNQISPGNQISTTPSSTFISQSWNTSASQSQSKLLLLIYQDCSFNIHFNTY